MKHRYSWPHTVYLAWQGDDPLYVGMTYTLSSRMQGHQAKSKWWPMTDGIDIYSCLNWQEAKELETQLIRTLRPHYNQRENQ